MTDHAGQSTAEAVRTTDAAFAKYAAAGAYHWQALGRHPLRHHAFTAERYRRTLRLLDILGGQRVLDYGCGDGALLGLISRQVGDSGEAHGFDPNADGLRLARMMLDRHRLRASLWSEASELPQRYFDRIVCAEVIEHVHDVPGLLERLETSLAPGGSVVITTPVRLTETPADTNHVQEWFPDEFRRLFEDGPFAVVRHETLIPAAAVEVYYWRPWFFLLLPVTQVLCNLVSICGFDALKLLRMRRNLPMQQMVLLRRRSE